MTNLFESAAANQIRERLAKLGPQSERAWGKMTAAQMLAHCSISMQWALGEIVPERMPLPARLVGKVIRPLVFRNDDPLRKTRPPPEASLWKTHEIWKTNETTS